MKNKKNSTFYDVIRYNLVIIFCFFVGFFLHDFLLANNNITLPFSLLNIYLFFVISAIIIVTTIVLLHEMIPNQIGYLFLTAICVKLGFFLIVFSDQIFGEIQLPMNARVSIIIPLFLFLALEGIAIGLTLKKLFSEVTK